MTITFHRATILILFEAWWILFMLIAKTSVADTWIGAAFSAITLLLVPGIATLLLIRIRRLDLWSYLSIALGLSILELMLIGLTANTLLPHIGVTRPLDFPVLATVVSVFVVALMTAQWMRRESIVLHLKKYLLFDTVQDWVLVLVPFVFVILSVLGAIILTNGGSGSLTYGCLVGIVLWCGVLVWYCEKTDENVVPIALFLLALALLFMTSLRGWYVTGHDIQREFEVFQLTHNAGLWSIARFKDAYNACLSITILPTVLSEFMRLNDPSVFKVLFQIIFATVPAMLFVILRRMVRPLIALLVALYFISFPTFFSDMPFLNRQEIAFVFLFLMFLVMTDERLSLRLRRVLFLLFGVGMILSHYSTTYTVVAILLFSTVAAYLMRWMGPYFGRLRIFRHSGVAALHLKGKTEPRITFLMAVALAGLSMLWSSVLTDTSSNSLYRVLAETLSVVGGNSGEDTRSNDVLYGLFSARHSDARETLRLYEDKVIAPKRAEEPDAYFSEASLSTYPLTPARPALMPLTSLGSLMQSSGIDVLAFNTAIRQTSAKVLQILMVIGFGALWVSAAHLKRPLDTEWVALMSGSILMLVVITALPVLSAEYGLLRAFQQSLLFVGLCIVLGNLALLKKAGERVALMCTAAFTILFMISSTGLVTQALGGYDAQLHLNNAGASYDLYYMHRGDILATEWLLREMQVKGIHAYQSGLAVNVLPLLPRDLTDGVEVLRSIYPGLVRTQSYVLVGPMMLTDGRGTLIYNGDVLTYVYPRAFLDENKNLLYTNGSSAVYR